MVRYYGIYARPVRDKIHALVADALKVLVRKAEQIAQRISFLRKIRGNNTGTNNHVEHVDSHEEGGVRCPHCGHGKMKLLRIWSKKRGFIYDAVKDEAGAGKNEVAQEKNSSGLPVRPVNEQLAFGFLASMA